MKRFLAIVLAVMMAFAVLAIPTTASTKLPAASEGFAFHCNDIEGGNGRTYIEGKAKDYGKFDKKTGEGLIQLAPAPGDTTGKVWVPVDDLGECTECGRSDWVSFSNKSGTPDGKNIQLQHPGPSRRWITIQVIYNLDIPACDIICNVADCDFAIECTADCECVDCGDGCGCGAVDHTCSDHVCPTLCDCATSYSERIVNEKVLINIENGYDFVHSAPMVWEGGKVNGASNFDELLFKSKTYNVYYVGTGDCVCECVCDGVRCECMKEVTACCYQEDDGTWICDDCDENPCTTDGCDHDCRKGCDHEWICSVCWDNADKGLRKGSHSGCHNTYEFGKGQNTFFCLKCGESENIWNNGKNPAPVDYCECPVCNYS